jgi:transposase-like protein
MIESVHRQFRKLTKIKGAFPNENSLLKLLYMGIQNAQKKGDNAYEKLAFDHFSIGYLL